MAEEVAIRVKSVSKCYHIYDKPSHRLMQGLVGGSRRFYKEFWALSDVDMEVRKGETYAIIGRNGSGKSTLLQVIAGTLRPTSGEVSVSGRVAALLELGSAFNPDFTGRENVYLNASVLGLSRSQIDVCFQSIVDFAGIDEEFIDRAVRSYSSGMVMRLAFAVMVHVEADILIIDEALSVGDAFFAQKCMRFLREFQTRGTLLFVSHDPGAVTSLCEKAVWLEAGRVVSQGNSKEVMASYTEAIIVQREGRASTSIASTETVATKRADIRQALIDRSSLRNDIMIPDFRPDAPGFGGGAATIVDVAILDEEGNPAAVVKGGEDVSLAITFRTTRHLERIIAGFYLKDKMGQLLFGDNTYLIYHDNPVNAARDTVLKATFRFVMPRLQAGDYFITAGVANGSQEEHMIQHWMHEALQLRSLGTSSPAGLIGIQMHGIELGEVSQ